MHSFRDPVHGFVRADDLEMALINSRPLQRLRSIRQLGFAYFVFPGAEHSRFSHVLGAMQLAGDVYDSIAPKSEGVLDPDPASHDRRLVRAAALLHDIGHAPFSHSAEELFEGGIDHEEMTRRLLESRELRDIFAERGNGIAPEEIVRLLSVPESPSERLLGQVVAGELDVDKMDYLLRDSLFCGVRYGTFDLARLLDTIVPLRDPESGQWGLGVEEGGVHALEALIMARYYMFTQVYFNVVGKAFELHYNRWLEETGMRWAATPEEFLEIDDVRVLGQMRRSDSQHACAVLDRAHFPLAFETDEHLQAGQRQSFEALLADLETTYGDDAILVSRSSKDPHRMGAARVFVRRYDGRLLPMEEASHFIRHLARIDRFRVYTPTELRQEVHDVIRTRWEFA